MTPGDAFRRARDLLIGARGDPDAAQAAFRWPELSAFNWTTDWFDEVASGNRRPALRAVGDAGEDRVSFDEARSAPARIENVASVASDPLLLYFTSGTTSKPKLVLHTHASYPVGHLSTMYWLGLREGDVHQNISSPGWAKHAWSCFFAPWNAGATVLVHDHVRFSARRTLEILRGQEVTTLCAPPTVWRMLALEPLGSRPARLRELASAGEPLNPEAIETIEHAWGIT